MILSRLMKIILAILFVGLISSCGGSGGGDEAKTTVKTHTLSGSTLRKMTAGDYWRYTGKLEYPSTTNHYDLEIDITHASGGDLKYLFPKTNEYLPVITSTAIYKYTDKSTGTVTQSSNGDYYVTSSNINYMMLEELGDDKLYPVNEGQGHAEKLIEDVIEKSSSSMYFTANNCHLENGDYVRCVKSEYHPSIVGTNILTQESATATLVGTELITTSIGIFECYKIKLNFRYTSNLTALAMNGESNETWWVYPAVGVIKKSISFTNTDYTPILFGEETYTLVETNISEY